MPLAGKAVLAIWNGIAPQAEAEFVAWHVREHIPERVGLPGFLRARRYVAEEGNPKYFNFYETERIEDLSSSAYLSRLDAPSPWTKAVVAHFTDTSRTICSVEHSAGNGDGAAIMTVKMGTSLPPRQFRQNIAEQLVPQVVDAPGFVAIHLLKGDADASRLPTAEKRLRDNADDVAEWILLIEAIDSAALRDMRSSVTSPEALLKAGVHPTMQVGIYLLQYALSASQLSPAPTL
jgi:hypothetical protein